MASADSVSICSDKDATGSQPFQSTQDDRPNSPSANHNGTLSAPHPHQRLSFQVSTQPNSSFASHEDLQCTWSESRQSINESATPRETRPEECVGPIPMNAAAHDSYYQNYLDIPVTSKAKALSLRERVRKKINYRLERQNHSKADSRCCI